MQNMLAKEEEATASSSFSNNQEEPQDEAEVKEVHTIAYARTASEAEWRSDAYVGSVVPKDKGSYNQLASHSPKYLQVLIQQMNENLFVIPNYQPANVSTDTESFT